MTTSAQPGTTPRTHWLAWTSATLAVLLIAAIVAAEYTLHHLGPIVRTRVIDTLSARFHAPVQLDDLQISLFRGIEVEGSGLRVLTRSSTPLISVQHFRFRTTAEGLLHQPTHLAFVRVDGMTIHMPRREDRDTLFALEDPQPPGAHQKIAFTAEEILATDTTIILGTSNPGREPLTLALPRLDLHSVGPGQPFTYDAQLINPKPTGLIHATGHFGPWKADDPRQTPVDGVYTFAHADLGTIKGLGGTLSSTGHFEGPLSHLTIDGATDTPNFSLDLSSHPLPLHTTFHAFVDATTGDTTLAPVDGVLGRSPILARGTIRNIRGQGHDIALDVTMNHARIEDVLTLAARTSPPILRGALALTMHLHIPPGHVRVMDKLESGGSLRVQQAVFNRTQWQDKLDGLSMRAQGKPEDAREAETDHVPDTSSQLTLNFRTDHGSIFVDNVVYTLPGVQLLMNGVYSTDGRVFEFAGHVRTQAHASQMVTGWKSLLLMPFDRMLAKNGAGLELPISISGTGGDIHFGLAGGGLSNDTSQQIQARMKRKP